MVMWYHVIPLFLLPDLLTVGGFRCGRDLSAAGSPRRSSSRKDDDTPVNALGGRAPSEFVMLFRNRASPLLDEKIRGTRTPGVAWRAYPHVRFALSAERCLTSAGGMVFGSPNNVGRTLRKGLQPVAKPYTSPARLEADGVEEILIDAGRLPEGRIPLTAVEFVDAFSDADAGLVADHLGRIGVRLKVCIDPKKGKYAAGQRVHPGADFLNLTRRYYEAVWSGDGDRQRSLRLELQTSCFD